MESHVTLYQNLATEYSLSICYAETPKSNLLCVTRRSVHGTGTKVWLRQQPLTRA